MDKITLYRQLLSDYLFRIQDEWGFNDQETVKAIVDQSGNHFLILHYGWTEQGHLHTVPVHLELIDNKVWIQENLTEIEIDDHLVDLGIPKSDIVLGVVPPEYRPFSAYAAA